MRETLAKQPMRKCDGDLGAFMQRLTTTHVALAFAPHDGRLRASLPGNVQILSGGDGRAPAHGPLVRGAERLACGAGGTGGGLALVEPVALASSRRDRRRLALDAVASRATAPLATSSEPPLRLECSLAFLGDEPRRLLDPGAPSVGSRMEALRFLQREGFCIFPRIDPLFPRDPLGGGKTMADFGLPDVQPLGDLEGLVQFSRELGARHIMYSVAKITRRKQGGLLPVMERMKRVYGHLAAGEPLVFRGGSWRLPERAAWERVLRPFLELCDRHAVPAKACKANLIGTP